jgi:hypothetical protein
MGQYTMARAAILFLGLVLPLGASAEPTTIRQVNWSMTIAEQVRVLEDQGLTCLQDTGWLNGRHALDTGGSRDADLDLFCIGGAESAAFISHLSELFVKAEQLCSIAREDGYSAPDCLGATWSFEGDLMRAVKVQYSRDGRFLQFDCSYLGTCGFGAKAIIAQLNDQVTSGAFLPAFEDGSLVCADGSGGDAVCLVVESRHIWLMKRPLRETMQF